MESDRVCQKLRSAGSAGAAREAPDVGALYDAHAGAIYRYPLALLGAPEESEDALQEVFLGLLRRTGEIMLANPQAYLFRAARNQALMVLRRRRRRQATAGLSWVDPQACGPTARELAIDLDRALRQLPPEQAEVIALKLGEGLAFREIAKILEIPMNTAASRYRLAVTRLRRLLEGGDSNA